MYDKNPFLGKISIKNYEPDRAVINNAIGLDQFIAHVQADRKPVKGHTVKMTGLKPKKKG